MGRVRLFPTGFVAVLMGWFTAEIGRQPWVVYGLLRTKDAVTPSLKTGDVVFSLLAYIAVYAAIYSFGLYYIYRVLRDGPAIEVSAALPGVARAGAIGGGAR
jgi:cytochrome d ubiquinol oxidase subunit I